MGRRKDTKSTLLGVKGKGNVSANHLPFGRSPLSRVGLCSNINKILAKIFVLQFSGTDHNIKLKLGFKIDMSEILSSSTHSYKVFRGVFHKMQPVLL